MVDRRGVIRSRASPASTIGGGDDEMVRRRWACSVGILGVGGSRKRRPHVHDASGRGPGSRRRPELPDPLLGSVQGLAQGNLYARPWRSHGDSELADQPLPPEPTAADVGWVIRPLCRRHRGDLGRLYEWVLSVPAHERHARGQGLNLAALSLRGPSAGPHAGSQPDLGREHVPSNVVRR